MGRWWAYSLEEALSELDTDIDDPDYTMLAAENAGQVIGTAVCCALEKSGSHKGLARPDNAGFLGFAAVFPTARGLGAGLGGGIRLRLRRYRLAGNQFVGLARLHRLIGY